LRWFEHGLGGSRVGWNKRSGSTKWERDISKARSAIDIYLDPLFGDELLLHVGFFLLLSDNRVFIAECFFVSGCKHRGDLLFLHSPLVEPLRLFHPTAEQ
jgi:hypothetical protein